MSVGELSGGDIKKAAEERTAKIARDAGATALTKARALLLRHTDLLDGNTVTKIGNREYHRAYQEAEAARAEGRMNDNYSAAPGLTIFLSKEGYEGLSEVAASEESEETYLAECLETVEPIDPEAAMYALRLPDGMYAMGWAGCSFYVEAGTDGRNMRREKPFSTPYSGVVRVEGDSGELWQNWNFQPDGTPRER